MASELPSGPESAPLIAGFRDRLEQLKSAATPHTYEAYMAIAIDQAILALEAGDYGVGAVLVHREGGLEYKLSARNQVFSGQRFTSHAECVALDLYELSRRPYAKLSVKERKLLGEHLLPAVPLDYNAQPRHQLAGLEPALGTGRHAILAYTVESCPRCFVTLADYQRKYPGTGINECVFGSFDEVAGGMIKKDEAYEARGKRVGYVALDRLAQRDVAHPSIEGYPAKWKQSVDGLGIVTPDFLNALNPEFSRLCEDVFNARCTIDQVDYQQLAAREAGARVDMLTNLQLLSPKH
ncbi:MAG TPA: hypothetical protein VFT53_01990 [Candidatus Saccharimonadales bacterium]|nr:hypothetical protein [Candidatus Saccharimonadales bacterium]